MGCHTHHLCQSGDDTDVKETYKKKLAIISSFEKLVFVYTVLGLVVRLVLKELDFKSFEFFPQCVKE